MRNYRGCFGFVAGGLALLGASPVMAASHSWRIAEIFSNASGTVQFIELRECCGLTGEHFVNGLKVTSQATGLQFTFPGNLPAGSTAGKRILLATDAFAALPGAPARDHAIPANFFSTTADTLRYNPAGNYDTFVFSAGQLPTDGVNSIQLTSFSPDAFITAVNNPTNYNGDPGSVNAGCSDADGDGYGNPGSAVCSNGAATDCNDNNNAVHPGATEVCTDDIDNDCDGDTDCEDAACAGVSACIPTVSEWGVLVLLLSLMISGVLLMQRRRAGAE